MINKILGFFFPQIVAKLEELERIKAKNLCKIGSVTMATRTGNTINFTGSMVSYHVRSWDGGKNWYACEYGPEDSLKVLGPMEEIYPGLTQTFEQLKTLEALAH